MSFGFSISGVQTYEGYIIETYTILNNIYEPDVSPYLQPCIMRNTREHSKKIK